MWEYFLALSILLSTYLYYILSIKPRKMKAKYVELFKKNGYKVGQLPFMFFETPYYKEWRTALEEKRDAFYHHRNQYFKYDVQISNAVNQPLIAVYNPELIKEIVSPEKVNVLPKFTDSYLTFSSIVQKGLIFLEKDEWKHHRKILSKVFNYDFIISQIPMMATIADKSLSYFQQKYWEENPEAKNTKTFATTLSKMMVMYSSSVVMSGFMGIDSMKEQLKGETIQSQLLKLSDLSLLLAEEKNVELFGLKFVQFGLTEKHREYLTLKRQVNEVLSNFVANTREQLQKSKQKDSLPKSQKTMIDLLLEYNMKEESSSQNYKINDEELIDEIKTFVIAGSDTTSNFLTAMILYTFEKPKVAEKLRKEINSIIHSDEDITIDNLKKLTYLECVMFQTSRMFSSSGGLFPRVASEDTTLFGVPIKKGTFIAVNWTASLHNPEVFEDPLEFKPDRWETEQCKQHSQMVALTFSGGPRGCIGKNLALTEAKVMMIKFMQRYQKLYEPGIKERSYQMILTMHIQNTDVEITKRE